MKESLLSTEFSPRSEYEVKQAPVGIGEDKVGEKEKLALSQKLPNTDDGEVFANPSAEMASMI